MICAEKIVVIKKDADVFALLARAPIFCVVSKTTKDMMCIDYWTHIQVTLIIIYLTNSYQMKTQN